MERFHFYFYTHSAAKFPCAAAVCSECMAFVKQRIIKFLQFDGRVLYVSLPPGNGRTRAVLERSAAPAAANDILADVAAAGFRIHAEDRIAAHIPLVCRRYAIGQSRRERAQDSVEHRGKR